MIAKNLIDLVGRTPLMELSAYSRLHGLPRPLVAKLEMFNPSGSVKARTALAMIEDAEVRRYQYRAYQRQYRHWPGYGGYHQGLPPYTYHARDHEP